MCGRYIFYLMTLRGSHYWLHPDGSPDLEAQFAAAGHWWSLGLLSDRWAQPALNLGDPQRVAPALFSCGASG
jgi:hypothetical protein